MTQTTQVPYAIGELLLASTLTEDMFNALIRAYHMPPEMTALMLLEEQPRRVVKQEERQDLLRFELFDPTVNLTSYTAGRIFHEQGELRWERQQANVQIVYTGHKASLPALPATASAQLDTYTFEDRPYLLFGKRLNAEQLDRIGPAAKPGDFAEVRIPRLLHYPPLRNIENADRIRLVVCEYIDPTTALTVAYRFKRLGPYRDIETTGVK